MLGGLWLKEYQHNDLNDVVGAQLIALSGIGMAVATAASKLRNYYLVSTKICLLRTKQIRL